MRTEYERGEEAKRGTDLITIQMISPVTWRGRVVISKSEITFHFGGGVVGGGGGNKGKQPS
jgi:hypothetical protein